jgi:YD repeat-containing protein
VEGDSSQGEIYFGYDELDRLISVTYPDEPEEARVTYDYVNVATRATELSGWVIGGAQDFVRTTDPRGNATLAIYDRDGQPVGVVDAKNHLTQYRYGAFGLLERIMGPVDLAAEFAPTIDFTHDNYGRLKSVKDAARGGTEQLSYNGLDEVI